tara:strand:- start:198 stop:737 length:540 start_codon:yes stop_codon:yes gene_type:complete
MKKLNLIIEKSILILILITFAFSLLNFVNENNLFKNINNSEILNEKCGNFIFSTELIGENRNIIYELDKKDIYIFPEIRNLICLGKIGDISYKENIFYGNTYTNTKFINYLLLFGNSTVLLISIFFRDINRKYLIYFFVTFNLGILYNFFFSLNIISLNFIFVPFLIFLIYTIEENVKK